MSVGTTVMKALIYNRAAYTVWARGVRSQRSPASRGADEDISHGHEPPVLPRNC